MSNLITQQIDKLAVGFGLQPDEELYHVLKATAFKTKEEVTDAQLSALLIVANQYGLNPWTKEIYAYPDKNNGIVPVVGVDGWSRIINTNPMLDGIGFAYSDETVTHKGKTCHVWVECIIHRKDRKYPIVVRERFEEVVRNANFATPWDTHPNRMHRHKTLIQCARLAFGFAGIYDQDEAERIIESIDATTGEITKKPAVAMPKAKSAPASTPVDSNIVDAEVKPAKPADATVINLGQTKYLLQKIAALELSADAVKAMLDRIGVAAIDTTMTVDQFDKIKAELLAVS